ncbi:hypothetical protein PDE_07839 [Penicillium oxalicum 114-2]|uniref:Uncharacterized protein n=1 Tax=Penicillium oxalicum (strain 114-2 / CGMCC 5302) TaxID=933388 RepID=S8B239_PENO1|nr:hypothetical protein PDE_07839 [Penicillium oxalicum 114-2]
MTRHSQTGPLGAPITNITNITFLKSTRQVALPQSYNFSFDPFFKSMLCPSKVWIFHQHFQNKWRWAGARLTQRPWRPPSISPEMERNWISPIPGGRPK